MSNTLPPLIPPRGMRDFYPADMVLRNHIFDAWRCSAERFGFQPYDAPVVEHLELLKRKAGEEIVHQIYTFEDKSGRELALRAEMTPTLARMVASRMGSLSLPIKWYTIAQCFRYERMTRGRKREHFQWNLDIIGEPSLSAEVEVIATAVSAMEAMGLQREDVKVLYNSRVLLAEIVNHAGILPDHHAATFLALDKRGKISDEQIVELLRKAELSESQCESVLAVLAVQDLAQARERLGADSSALAQIDTFEALLAQYDLNDVVSFDIGVIRGLSYYTGIVFEAFDTRGVLRAIFGGGRYDNLLRDVGGKPETGVGLGFGDVVIAEILAESGCVPAERPTAEIVIGYMQDAQQTVSMRLAAALRAEGSRVDLALHAEKPKSFFSRAGRNHYAKAIYVGPDDVALGSVKIKDLLSREETPYPLP